VYLCIVAILHFVVSSDQHLYLMLITMISETKVYNAEG